VPGSRRSCRRCERKGWSMSEEFCRSSSATRCLSGMGLTGVEGRIGVRFVSTKGFCRLSPVLQDWTLAIGGRSNQVAGSLIRWSLLSGCGTRVHGNVVSLSEQSCDTMPSGSAMSSGRRHYTENPWKMRLWVLLQIGSLWSPIQTVHAQEFCRNTG